MVDDGRPTRDVVTQIRAVGAALDAVGLSLVERDARQRFEDSATSPEAVDALVADLAHLMGR
ncbi:metal-sensing transcriptional repressor [Thermoleophilum album]